MPNLIGSGPDQVPSNGHLGTLAYQDADHVVIRGGIVLTDQSVQVPVTGFSITMDPNIPDLILDPAGTLATGTVVLPAYPRDRTKVTVCSTQTITALTLSPNTGQTVKNAPTTLAAGAAFSYRFNLGNLTWYRQGLG